VSNLAAYFPRLETVPRVREPVFRVEVGGHWRPWLRPVVVEQRAGALPRVRLALDSGEPARGGSRRMVESALRAVAPDDLVTVDLVRGGALSWRGSRTVRLFEGYVDGPAFTYGPGGEMAGFWAADRSASVLAHRVHGQYVENSVGDPLWLSGIDLVFNPDGLANMSEQSCASGGGRSRKVFVAPDGESAQQWTVSEAANYLVSFYAAASYLALPTAAELDDLFGDDVLENVRLEGRTVMEALEQLGRRVGLRATVALARDASGNLTRTLVFTGRGRGRRVSLYHQMPGETFTLARTAIEKAEVHVAWADAPAGIHLAGDLKLYESTFDLVPGWDPSAEGEERDVYRRSHPDFADYADVYRKWVLNEAGDYTGEPWSAGPAYDFSSLFGTSSCPERRRRFLPAISTDDAGESYGVCVEVSYDGGATWSHYCGAVRVLRDECGVALSSDQLPPELFRAAERDDLAIRVTAAVESDARLGVVVERPGLQDDHRGRRLWIDVSDDYHFRKVDSGSIFSGGASREVDDTERLTLLAADLWQAGRHAPVPCRIGLPMFSVGYRVGDRIDGIRYRYAWLKRSAAEIETDPMVDAVWQRWTPDEGWRTELELV
jgi:hypothetical protein